MSDAIVIQIMPSQVAIEKFEGTSKTTGKPFEIYKQSGWIYNGDDFPKKFDFLLEKDVQPYSAGKYTLHPTSFGVGDFLKLVVDKVVLVPLDIK